MPSSVIKAKDAIYTSYQCDNNKLIREVAKLYLPVGSKVADVTYGKGVFWRHMNMKVYDFYPSDLITCPETPYDFTKLPYADKEFDVTVIDPPYVHNPGKMIVDSNYQNASTTKGLYHADIMELYRKGMKECTRILKNGGTLWVKCKDEVESSTQRWSHCEILDLAFEMGLYAKDLFILTQQRNPILQHQKQQHARKNHSYLWIFRKPQLNEIKKLMKVYPRLKNCNS